MESAANKFNKFLLTFLVFNYKLCCTVTLGTDTFVIKQSGICSYALTIDRITLKGNRIRKVFDVPGILTTIETKVFSGYMRSQLLEIFSGNKAR